MFKWIKEKLGRNVVEKKEELNEKENETCEFDFSESLTSTLNKRFDREARAQEIIAEQYDLDELSDQEYNKLWRKEFHMIIEKEEAEELRKKALLRRIKTLRTKEEIETAVEDGHKVLKQKVEPSKDIRVTDLHIKDKQTGEIIIKPYNYHALPHDYDRYEIVEKRTFYPYKFPSKEAAYFLPDTLKVGERVILEDLIEDIVGESHAWGTYRLDSAEAIWNGEKFKVDCRSYDVRITMG